jgi:lysophospholipase L1-like esterase
MSSVSQTDSLHRAAPVRVLLLGDSTVMGSVPRLLVPEADHLEDIIRKLLAGEPDLPPVEVINKGQDNDTIQRMLANRYEQDVARLRGPPVDFVLIRFGINDRSYLAHWESEFPETYHRLIASIRRDQPRASITLETIIPYRDVASTHEVNETIHQIAKTEGLPLLDTHAQYAEALRRGPDTLNYRAAPLAAIPLKFRRLLSSGSEFGGTIYILDNTLDVHFQEIPGWFRDRHPNLAGYHVIGNAVAEYLKPLIRMRTKPRCDSGHEV